MSTQVVADLVRALDGALPVIAAGGIMSGADSAAKIAAINRKGAADRSAIIAQNGRDISDIQMSIYRTQSASGDYIQRESSEAIRGVETYNDQYNGGTVELDIDEIRAATGYSGDAGAVAVVQGSHNGGREESWGHIVGIGAHYSGRVPVWPPSHRVKP